MKIVALGLAFAAAFTSAAVFFPALAWTRRARAVAFVALATPVLLTPLLVPADRRLLRYLAAVLATVLAVKLYDLQAHGAPRTTLRAYLTLLANPFGLILRKLDVKRRPPARADLAQLGLGLAGAAGGACLLAALFGVDWARLPFALEYVAWVLGFYIALLPPLAAAVAAWRLLGGAGLDVMNRPWLARTPADFWRRYNLPMQQFFYEDVFKPSGGLRAPVRATLLTFAVSAVIHEYIFGIALGRVQGYQTAFFLLQGAAVAATARVKPRGWGAAVWVTGTWAFLLASSVLFFASMNGVAPVYSRPLPVWAADW
jgi:hypothetical protein